MSWLRVFLLLTLVAAAYANTLSSPFVFDDVTSIVYNPCIQTLHPLQKIFSRSVDLDLTPWGRPLVALSLALNFAWGGLNVVGYHLFNIVVHLINGLVLWRLAYHLLKVQRWSSPCATAAEPLSFVIASLWLVHPLATSVATYTVQRAESMMALFYLSTLYCAARFWETPNAVKWAWFSVLFCWSGMLSKESMVTAPVAVLLLGWIFHRPTFLPTLQAKWFWVLTLLFSWVILAAVMFTWPRHATVGSGPRGMHSWEYFLIQMRVIPHYFALVVWPTNLCLNYPQRFWATMKEVPPDCWPLITSPEQAIVGLILVLGAIGSTLWLLGKRPGIGFLALLPLLILAPTSSVVPITTSLAADHRMYLPCAALIALAVIGFFVFTLGAPKSERNAIASLRVTISALGVLLLLIATVMRNQDYQDAAILWNKSLLLNPKDALGWNELGGVYWSRKDIPNAARAFEIGSQACPSYTLPRVNLAVCQWNLGLRQQGIDNLLKVTIQEPANLNAWQNLATFYDQLHDSRQSQACREKIAAFQAAASSASQQ